jgi:hypothetical protein
MSRCKNCGSRFEPRFSTLEKFCWDPECKTIEALKKLEAVKKLEARNWKARKSELKKANKNASDYRNDLQKIFNTWIRLRDQDQPCISCGLPLTGKFDAGHFHSVGSYPNLRYNIDNVHGQCVECNQHKRGNLIEYRNNLIKRIGIDRMEALNASRKLPLKLTIPEIIDLIYHYKALIKILRSE